LVIVTQEDLKKKGLLEKLNDPSTDIDEYKKIRSKQKHITPE